MDTPKVSPWFDGTCNETELVYKKALEVNSGTNLKHSHSVAFLRKTERNYKTLLNIRRISLEEGLQSRLASAINTSEIWKAIKKFKRKKSATNKI